MNYKTFEEIELLVNAFEERTLPKSEWNHQAHLVVGLYYCYHYKFGFAKNLMGYGIYWLNEVHGTPNTANGGYHATLNVFWMKTIAEFIDNNSNETNLATLANKLITSCSDLELPLQFYSRELLFSRKARMNYVEPDVVANTIITAEFVCLLQAA